MKFRITAAHCTLHLLVALVLVLVVGSPVRAEALSLPVSVQFQPLGAILDSTIPRVFQSALGGDVIENGAFRLTYSAQRSPLQLQFSSSHFTGSIVVSYSVEGCAVGPFSVCLSLGSCAGTGTVDFAGDVTASDDGALHVGFVSVAAHPAECNIAGFDAVPKIASKVESTFRDHLTRGGASFEAQSFFQGSISRVWASASTPIVASSAVTLQFRPQAIWLENVSINETSAQARLHLTVAPELDLDPAGSGPSSPVFGRTPAGSGRQPFNLVVPASQVDSRVRAALNSASAPFSAATSVDDSGVSLALSFLSGGTGVARFVSRVDGAQLVLAFAELSVDGVADGEQGAADQLFKAGLSIISVLPESLRSYATIAESNGVLNLSCRYRLGLQVGSRHFAARATGRGIEVQLSRAETTLIDSCAPQEFDPTAPPRWVQPICAADCI